MKDTHVRLSDEENQKLARLSAKLGLSGNEIIRRLLDNADEEAAKAEEAEIIRLAHLPD